MTPGKEGPGKGKNITVSADFWVDSCIKIVLNFYRDPVAPQLSSPAFTQKTRTHMILFQAAVNLLGEANEW